MPFILSTTLTGSILITNTFYISIFVSTYAATILFVSQYSRYVALSFYTKIRIRLTLVYRSRYQANAIYYKEN